MSCHFAIACLAAESVGCRPTWSAGCVRRRFIAGRLYRRGSERVAAIVGLARAVVFQERRWLYSRRRRGRVGLIVRGDRTFSREGRDGGPLRRHQRIFERCMSASRRVGGGAGGGQDGGSGGERGHVVD
jgi:hypothetical protein